LNDERRYHTDPELGGFDGKITERLPELGVKLEATVDLPRGGENP
jgi:hypothetical protein